jgi:DNA gyrase subunit A
MSDSHNSKNGATANGASPNGLAHTNGRVRLTDITHEMQGAYLDYAMSVIVARALPDVRDGLKPVHRRILYAMWHDLSLTWDKPHKKSARIVGEVLGKYHPHGDSSVYDAMVRMAQPFAMRYPLIDGQGNFGSIDGDNAAAMRYTEARLARLSDLMLEDLEKDTVAWGPNFDNSLREPLVVPAALPNLLINGSSGIAVGMATNIPPHNLGEVVDGLVHVIDHFDQIDEVTVEDLMQHIKGPDFPTGGILYRLRDDEKGGDGEHVDIIAQGYATGKARLVMQAKAHFEEMSRGRMRVIITELPYQTNKTALIERIADLVRDGKVEGIGDLRDESDRTGMRICIELKRDYDPKAILADLYKYTPLQQTFGMQLLALVDGQPKLLTLKRILQLFVQHRQEIIRRRSEWELAKARERIHIVEGLLRALDILDEVIATIRKSQSADTAKKNLVANFKFTEVQAQAILDMQLRRLAALERKKLQEEHDELSKRIKWLLALLADPKKVLELIKSDLLAIKEQFADARRTQIVDRTKGTHTTTDLIADQQVLVTVGSDGEVRRTAPGRLTAASLRAAAKNGEVALISANTRDLLYVFNAAGRCARIGIHELPVEGSKHVSELGAFTRRERIVAAFSQPRPNGDEVPGYLFLVTEKAVVKRVTLADVGGAASNEFGAISVDEKDKLGWAFPTPGNREVMLLSSGGQAIRFAEEEVRSMGFGAAGVGGMKLGKNESIAFAALADSAGALLTFTQQGFAKLTPLGEYPTQGRNGGGVAALKTSAKTGALSAAEMIPAQGTPKMLALLAGRTTPKSIELDEIPQSARATLGKQIVSDMAVTAIRYVVGAEEEEPTTFGKASTPALIEDAAPARAARTPAPASTTASAPVKLEPKRAANSTTTTEKSVSKSAQPVAKAAPQPETPVVKASGKTVKLAVTRTGATSTPATSPKPATETKSAAARPAPAKPAAEGQASLFDEPAKPAKKPSKLDTVTSVKKK